MWRVSAGVASEGGDWDWHEVIDVWAGTDMAGLRTNWVWEPLEWVVGFT